MTAELGERLRAQRAVAGVSQASVAEALALDASAVSRIEKGTRSLSAFELGVLAEVFGWDPRGLLGIERPRQKLAVAARLRDVDGSAVIALSRAATLVEVDALLDDVNLDDASQGLAVSEVLPRPTNRRQADQEGAEFADVVRDKLGADGAIGDLIGFCERNLGMDVLVTSVPDECDGAVVTGDRVALAVLDSEVMSGRQRFTLAHEIGHAVMGDVVDSVLVDGTSVDKLVEARASAFAASLLMPAEPLKAVAGASPGPVELVEAMVMFGVSWAALRRRCQEVGVEVPVSLEQCSGSDLFAHAGRASEEARVTASIGPRIPARIDRRVRHAYAQALVGAGVVGMAFGVSGEELDVVLEGMTVEFEMPPPSLP